MPTEMKILYEHHEDIKRLNFIAEQVDSYGAESPKVLDVGCGNGIISIALGSLGYQVTGIDIDPDSIEFAKKNNPYDNVDFVVMNVEDELLNEKFDIVICSEVIEHLYQPTKFLMHIREKIRPGGMVIITVTNGYGPREMLMTRPMQFLTKKGFGNQLLKLKKLLGYKGATVQSSNPDLTHVKFFRLSALIKTMGELGFDREAFGKADAFGRVFPFSMLTNNFPKLQKLDCKLADFLPKYFSSGFYTSWIYSPKTARQKSGFYSRFRKFQAA